MTSLVKAAVAFIVILGVPFASYAGSLDSSGAPAAGSNMPTLTDIYNQLDTGATSAPAASFQEPSSGPTSGTGRSLSEIRGKLPAPDNANGAAANDVKSGKTFWGLRTDGTWGFNTGSLSGGYICATGDLSPLGRWCDNGDGTIRDMTTGLIWLKDANCAGFKTWEDADIWSQGLASGTCGLSDGSVAGDWRMPTKKELFTLTNGTEYTRAGTPRNFVNVRMNYYWTSSTMAPGSAWTIFMWDGGLGSGNTTADLDSDYVLPVRDGQ